MRKSESYQVASDKVGLGAMWVDLPTRMSAWLPCSLDTVPRALSGAWHEAAFDHLPETGTFNSSSTWHQDHLWLTCGE